MAIRVPGARDLFSSPLSYTRALVDDVSALLAATATSITAKIAGPTGGAGVTINFAGAEVTRKAAGKRVLPRTIAVTTGAHAGTYKIGAGNPLVLTGTFNGVAATESLLLTATGGAEIVRGAQLWDDPTLVLIAIPGQNDALGTFAFGLDHIGAPSEGAIRGIKAMAAGNVVIMGADGKFDTVVLPIQGPPEWIQCARVCATGGGDTTTALPITVYL